MSLQAGALLDVRTSDRLSHVETQCQRIDQIHDRLGKVEVKLDSKSQNPVYTVTIPIVLSLFLSTGITATFINSNIDLTNKRIDELIERFKGFEASNKQREERISNLSAAVGALTREIERPRKRS